MAMINVTGDGGTSYPAVQKGASGQDPTMPANAFSRFMQATAQSNAPQVSPGYNFASPNPRTPMQVIQDVVSPIANREWPWTIKGGFEVRDGQVVPAQAPGQVPEDVMPTRGPDKPGYYQQAVYGSNGIIGYRYMPLLQAGEVRPSENTSAQPSPETRGWTFAERQQLNTGKVEDRIRLLEQTYQERAFATAVQTHGGGVAPDIVRDPISKDIIGYDWAKRVQESGRQYLGLGPGQLGATAFPGVQSTKGMSQQELLNYEQALRQRVPIPTYQEADVWNTITNMPIEERRKFQRNLIKAGAYSADTPVRLGVFSKTEIEYMRGLMTDANLNGLKWTDVLQANMIAAEKQRAADAAARAAAGGGGSGSGSSVYTQVNYSLTSISEARSLLGSVLRNALGRYPTDQEVSDFVALLNAQERKAPVTTVTRTNTGGGATRAVTRSTPSTVDAMAMAEEFASQIDSGKEEARYQADNYIAGFLQSLGGA